MRCALCYFSGAVSSGGSGSSPKFWKGLLSCSLSSVVVPTVYVLPLRPTIPYVGSCGTIFSGINDSCPSDSLDVRCVAGYVTGAGEFSVLLGRRYSLSPSLEVILASEAVTTVVFLSILSVPVLRFCLRIILLVISDLTFPKR